MKRLLKKLSAGLVVAALTVGMAFSSFANSGSKNELQDIVSKIEEYADSSSHSDLYEDAKEKWSNIDSKRNEDKYKYPDAEITLFGVTFDSHEIKFYNTSTDDEFGDPLYKYAIEQMKPLLTDLGDVNDNPGTVEGTKKRLSSLTENLGIAANLDEASNSLESLAPLISTASGLIIIVTLLGLSIFTAFDVAYLTFPVAKSAMDNAGSSGNRSVSKTDGKTGEAKFRWVTDDAINAYQQSVDTGKNPLMCYLGKRVWSYVAVAIVVYILMSGNITIIIEFVLNILESFFGMLSGLSMG